MARYQIENENIVIAVDSYGAELKSLRKKAADREYLWCADPAYWGRTAPVLFPFVGSLKNKEYRTKGRTYPMGQHGFARDMEFDFWSESRDDIWFILKSDEETLARYPYEFQLRIGYQLRENGVDVIWEVDNPGEEDLPFSIGGHPAFCFEGPGSIYMDGPECMQSTVIRDGLAVDERVEYHLEDGRIAVTEHLFDRDALIFEEHQAGRVALCGADGAPYLTVEMDAPLFGIWSPPGKNAPFICIEPWYGRCDAKDFDGELTDRKWGNLIAPKETWSAQFSILV